MAIVAVAKRESTLDQQRGIVDPKNHCKVTNNGEARVMIFWRQRYGTHVEVYRSARPRPQSRIGSARRGDILPSRQGLRCSVTCERIVQRGAFDPKGAANRRFARTRVQGSPDRG